METKEQCHVFHIFSDLKALFDFLYVEPFPWRSRQAWTPPRAASLSVKGKGRETHIMLPWGRKAAGESHNMACTSATVPAGAPGWHWSFRKAPRGNVLLKPAAGSGVPRGLEPGLHIPKPRAWKAEAEMLYSLRKQSRAHKSPHARSIHHPRWIKAVKLMIIISTLCTGKQTAGEEKRPTAGPCGLHGSSAPTHFPGRGMSKRAGAGICWWGQLSQQGTPSLQRSQTFIYFASLVV